MLVKEVKEIVNSSIQNVPLMDAINITDIIMGYVQVNIYWLTHVCVEEINPFTLEPDIETEIKACFLAKNPEQAWNLYHKSGIPIALSKEEFLAHLRVSRLNNGQRFYSSTPKIHYFSIVCYYNRDGYSAQEYVYKRPTKHTKRKQILDENTRGSSIWFAPMIDILFDGNNYTNN
jgi:hypothetical protein